MTVAAGGCALAALLVVVASLGYLHLAPTGLSPVRNAVSQYGITPFRSGYRVATIAFAVSGAALAVALARTVGSQRPAAVVTPLAIFAAARAVISWFPMDAPGTPRTPTGQTHGLLAIAAFGSVTYAAFHLGDLLDAQPTWHALGPVSTGLGAAMAAALLGMALARAHPAIGARFGAVERGFYVCAIAWCAVFAVASVSHLR